MRNNKLCSFLAIIAIVFIVLSIMPDADALITSGYRHTYDYYAVTFDGEGDAIVSARLTIKNTDTKPIKTIILEFPQRILVYDVTQQATGRTCGRYQESSVCDSWDGNVCKHYSSQQQCSYWYDYGTEYIRLNRTSMRENVLSDVTALTLELPVQIDPEKTSTIMLSYKINEYAKRFVNWHFDFETIIDNNAALIENARVAVDVQQGFYLKGGASEVEYRPDVNLGMMQKAVAESSMDVGRYNDYSYTIEHATGIVKTATYLDPGESFHVKGTYGTSWFTLHLGTFAIILLIILALIFGIKRLSRQKKGPQKSARTPAEKQKKMASQKDDSDARAKSELSMPDKVFRSLGLALMSSVMITFFTWIGMVIITMVNSRYYYQWQTALSLLIGLLIIVVDIFFLSAPSFFVGKRHGLGYGFLTFMATIIFLIMILVFLAFIFSAVVRYPIVNYMI